MNLDSTTVWDKARSSFKAMEDAKTTLQEQEQEQGRKQAAHARVLEWISWMKPTPIPEGEEIVALSMWWVGVGKRPESTQQFYASLGVSPVAIRAVIRRELEEMLRVLDEHEASL